MRGFSDKKKVNEYRERRDFSRVNNSLDLGGLLEIQTKSYNWFIRDGIKEVLEEISPVENFSGTLSLERFGEYSFDEPRHTIKRMWGEKDYLRCSIEGSNSSFQ